MHIKSMLTDDDREELEGILLLGLRLPKYTTKIRRIYRIILYVIGPVEFFLSIDCYLRGKYLLFGIGISVCIACVASLVFGKKFENLIHEFVWRKSKYDGIDINENEIKISEDQFFEFENIDRMFLYKNFFFFITDEKKIYIFKASDKELGEVIKIIEIAGVLFERKDRPFNIYKYCKRWK